MNFLVMPIFHAASRSGCVSVVTMLFTHVIFRTEIVQVIAR